MVHWFILLIYIINVPYFYGTSANERSATRSRDLNGPITGKYYLNFGRENEFQKEVKSDLVR